MAANNSNDAESGAIKEASTPVVKPEHEFLVSRLGLERFPFREIQELDKAVYRIDFEQQQSWIVRQFPNEQRDHVAQHMVNLLTFLEAHSFPAEKLVPDIGVVLHEGTGLVATQFLKGEKPLRKKEVMIKFGYFLGKLGALPYGETSFQRKGGSWHHICHIGGPKQELMAAKAVIQSLTNADEAKCKELCAILDSFDCFDSLPEALIHADFVPPNALINEDDKINFIDWAGAGLGPRVWALGFLLFVGGIRNIKLVDCIVGGYRKWDRLEPSELDVLESAILARPLVIECWEVVNRGKTVSEILDAHHRRKALSGNIVERAREKFAEQK